MIKKILAIFASVTLLSFLSVSPALAQVDYEYDWDSSDWESTWEELDSEYNVDSTLTDEEAAAAALFATVFGGVFFLIFGVFSLVGYIYAGLTLMTIAKKLNEKNPWLAWVPFGNMYLFSKLAGFSGWLGLLFFVPAVNFVFAIVCTMKIAERRGFENWLGLLLLVPVVNVALPGYLAWANPPVKK